MANTAGLSRRRVLAGALGAGGLGVLVACGNQVDQLQSAPYATNAARNTGGNAPAAAGQAVAATPAAHGSAMVGMDPNAIGQSAGTAPASGATATPAKDWQMMNQMHAAGVKAFLAQPKTLRGGQRMAYTMQDGVKVFNLTAKPVQWEVTPGQMIDAYAYNGVVPGPEIRVTQGDTVRVILKNELDEGTAIHWHGLLIPNAMDGVPFITQPPVNPGESFTYEFTARNPGSHMYHSHMNSAEQVTKGLLGAFIIEPKDKSAYPTFDKEYTMILGDAGLGFTLNGKGFPATEAITVNKGEKLLVRFMNEGLMIHPMHLHGMPMTIVAQDGYVNTPYKCDTVNVAPGQRFDAIVDCTEVGTWVFHCHILSHAESEHGMFGMMTALIVK
ncbi:MAG: copper oxidase [Chloroflexota bacterium]|nr:copper oxidase [Chloroflexota bacterium]